VPPTFQDMIIHMVTTTSVGYTILLHIQLFHIFPLLAFGPFIVLCIIVNFWIKAGKANAKAKLAKLMPSPVVQQRKQIVATDTSKNVLAAKKQFLDSDDEDDLEIEIDLRLPEVEDLVVPDDNTWKNFGNFVYRTEDEKEELVIVGTPACSHVTRRQSVAQGVQLLHRMRAVQDTIDEGDNIQDDILPAISYHHDVGMIHANSTNSLEYAEDEKLFRREVLDESEIDEVELEKFEVDSIMSEMTKN